jgi:hypothetical protein
MPKYFKTQLEIMSFDLDNLKAELRGFDKQYLELLKIYE